ncbi:MAG: type III-B CRISPR module RAMP protein Cmr6 [Acidimicrobiaceae bacterium]|nr:type III-B CRISPR module RAMP protein Cmr6 [Acidimicrobiaceae bacterium]
MKKRQTRTRTADRKRSDATNKQPLYKGAEKAKCDQRLGHAGLWFDKYCNRWSNGRNGWKLSTDSDGSNLKLEWVRTVANGMPVGAKKQIEEYTHRVARLVRGCAGRFAVFETESRFVTGIGLSHPVGNGFAWHPTLGTPYLPGTSVKGLVRAWVKTDTEPRPDQKTVERVFGADNASGSIRHVGTVCFLDATPITPVKLDADVITPHYASWTLEQPPGDWSSPTPIPFLTVAAKTCFLFGVISRFNPATDDPGVGEHFDTTTDDLELVFGWLESALEWSGAGAKTAVGYGRFRWDAKKTRDLEKQLEDEERRHREELERREAMKSPEGRWRFELKDLSETQLLDKVRIHLEKDRIEDPEERRAFVEAVWDTGFPEFWRKGRPKTQTNVGKKKLKQRAQLIQKELGHLQP